MSTDFNPFLISSRSVILACLVVWKILTTMSQRVGKFPSNGQHLRYVCVHMLNDDVILSLGLEICVNMYGQCRNYATEVSISMMRTFARCEIFHKPKIVGSALAT